MDRYRLSRQLILISRQLEFLQSQQTREAGWFDKGLDTLKNLGNKQMQQILNRCTDVIDNSSIIAAWCLQGYDVLEKKDVFEFSSINQSLMTLQKQLKSKLKKVSYSLGDQLENEDLFEGLTREGLKQMKAEDIAKALPKQLTAAFKKFFEQFKEDVTKRLKDQKDVKDIDFSSEDALSKLKNLKIEF